MGRRLARTLSLPLAFLVASVGSTASADGTETLGLPSIPVAGGSGLVAAGTGLVTQPGSIVLNVPGTPNQVLLYWEGRRSGDGLADDTLTVNGLEVSGTLIGGPTLFVSTSYSSVYRADVTGLGLVGSGMNALEISGLDLRVSHGAGLLVVYDDGATTADLDLVDGVDIAYVQFPEPRQTTVPQTLDFAPSNADRMLNLVLFVSSVSGTLSTGEFRPSAIDVTIGGITETFDNLLNSVDGEEWDTVSLDVVVPAGESSVTIEVKSIDNLDIGGRPASLNWIAAASSIQVNTAGGGQGCTPGYWKQSQHFDSWALYSPGDDYEGTFGIDASFSKTLLGTLKQGGGREKALGRHAVAALLNSVDPDVDYALSSAEVIALVQSAYVNGDYESAKDQLARENESGCPLN